MDLTYKQRLFVSYYLGVSQGNAADAARRAGYAWPEKQGPQQLAKTSVRAAVDAKLSSVAMSQDEILARLGEIAAADLLSFLVDRGGDAPGFDLRRARRRGRGWLLRKFKAKGGDVDVELESKLAAMFKLGEYHGMWNRDRPPDVSIAELARRLKEKHDRKPGMGDADGSPG